MHSLVCASRIRTPIDVSLDDKSQFEEFLTEYDAESIHHIARSSCDIHASVEYLRKNGLEFMPVPPDTYYKGIDARLQIFSNTVIGPIYIEFIQRNDDDGFDK